MLRMSSEVKLAHHYEAQSMRPKLIARHATDVLSSLLTSRWLQKCSRWYWCHQLSKPWGWSSYVSLLLALHWRPASPPPNQGQIPPPLFSAPLKPPGEATLTYFQFILGWEARMIFLNWKSFHSLTLNLEPNTFPWPGTPGLVQLVSLLPCPATFPRPPSLEHHLLFLGLGSAPACPVPGAASLGPSRVASLHPPRRTKHHLPERPSVGPACK